MSDEIDSNTNYLCTTADVFEDFQATSMYEKDDNIVFSESVSTSVEKPSSSVELHDEITKVEKDSNTSTSQEQVPVVNSTIESGTEESSKLETLPINMNADESEYKVEKLEIVKSKRGRKKVIQPDLQENTKEHRIAGFKTNGSVEENINISVTNKRGRKAKRSVESISIVSQSIEQQNVGHEISVTSKKRGRPRKQQSQELDSTTINPRKRGRPRKNISPTENNVETNDSVVTDDLILNEESLIGQKLQKRRRGKKTQIENTHVNNDVAIMHESKNIDESNKPEQMVKEDVPNDDQDIDDICLSKLKATCNLDVECSKNPEDVENIEIVLQTSSSLSADVIAVEPAFDDSRNLDVPVKRNSKMSIMPDFEYNIDNICNDSSEIKENSKDQVIIQDSLLVEDTSKRPIRKRANHTLLYDEGSDEDPFANVESSDEEPRKGKRSGKYYSDDEYVPGALRRAIETTSDSDIDKNENNLGKQKKKKRRSDLFTEKSPKKRGKKVKKNVALDNEPPFNDESSKPVENKIEDDDDDDIEICSYSTTVKMPEMPCKRKRWDSSDELQNFIAKKLHGIDLKIKKGASVQPIVIPVLSPNEVMKNHDNSTQTFETITKSVEVQTTAPHDIPVTLNVPLTTEQSEKACEFLKSIVKTTSELGELMTQKSEDFIKKKINTDHVTDSFKMDYCVRKSFLLFKLAKHNLLQMEEDLAKSYDEFLKSNNLTHCREKPKELAASANSQDNDSDCEIVEIATPENPKKAKEKPAFNPKTVFLNKELSIKIAKKPSDDKRLNIKGRHTVWINDSVMVKKVKPNQSFLAQDSRNKKPPDYVTLEMLKNFFKEYNRQHAVVACAPYVNTEWISHKTKYVCGYFIKKHDNISTSPRSEEFASSSSCLVENNNNILNNVKTVELFTSTSQHIWPHNPKTLFSLCTIALQKQFSNYKCHKSKIYDDDVKTYNPRTLTSICTINIIKFMTESNEKLSNIYRVPPSLRTLCYQKIKSQIFETPHKNDIIFCQEDNYNMKTVLNQYHNEPYTELPSLFTLCVKCVQNQFKTACSFPDNMKTKSPVTLKIIALEKVVKLMYQQDRMIAKKVSSKHNKNMKTLMTLCFDMISKRFSLNKEQSTQECMTINSVNTLTEEAYLSIAQTNDVDEESQEFYEGDDLNFYEDFEENVDDNNFIDDNMWCSKVQMQELLSCAHPIKKKLTEPDIIREHCEVETKSFVGSIKIEPLEESETIDTSIVKSEPLMTLDEMTIIPENIITKTEMSESDVYIDHSHRRESVSCNIEEFENFVASNKLMNYDYNSEYYDDRIFEPSSRKIRRQFEPDNDMSEFHLNMDLLVPQTFEPVNIDSIKNKLMKSSDDENINVKKNPSKKKNDKRKLKSTKPDQKADKKVEKVKDVPKEKCRNEIAVLTRKTREKFRKEQQKDISSESDQGKSVQSNKANTSHMKNDEIQCNNVDSTQQILDKSNKLDSPYMCNDFTGFTAVDQFAVHTYQKYVEHVYNKLMPNISEKNSDASNINEEPVELLECEPSISMILQSREENHSEEMSGNIIASISETKDVTPLYTERFGWKCYPLDMNDKKLYQDTQIVLEKLPECFAQTYFTHQNITMEDKEINRLVNLQTLHKSANKVMKENRKIKVQNESLNKSTPRIKLSGTKSKPASPANSDNYEELQPSEESVEKESPVVQNNGTENYLPKSSLMEDQEADKEKDKVVIKEEHIETDIKPVLRSRPGPKSKCKPLENTDPSSLLLTVDKMMNRELNLLHAPVDLNPKIPETISKGPVTRQKKNSSKSSSDLQKHVKVENDSSSEEEKQWFTIKEKLLKKMIKKKDSIRQDDAKRAKLVSEFIERRGDQAENYIKRRSGRGGRRSTKKMLERQKQLRVLSSELFGDRSHDASVQGKTRCNQANFKGRRNIRKVIDKKSLAGNTVVANMEEFERKRRINMRQAKLREFLGCEEGVNVFVINDEVCLEYDFEEQRPVVTIHPFFTKVMKAHQFEGVKFMWDACFESLDKVSAGGGGCILAHCMGLGKTLQVLALLHTVLTHPRLGMKRVLVCCPLSTVLNWVDEIHKWIGPVTKHIKVFELSKLKKIYERAYQLEDWYKGGGIFIIGYELFRSLTTLDPYLDDVRPTIVNKIRTALLDPGPDIIICDEGHLLKNDCSVLAVAMSRVATKRRIVLTGTPMQNNLREYFCMVNFVKPNLLGTYAEYSNRFENPIMNGQHRDSLEADIKLMKARTHILHKVLEGCLQRQEASVLYPYLPKKHEYTVFISLTDCQWDLYKHYMEHYANTQSNKSVLKDFHTLQKIWTHPQVLHNFQTRSHDEAKNKVKIEKLEDDLAREDLTAYEDTKPRDTEVWWLQYLEGGQMLESLESSHKFAVVFSILQESVALGDKVLIFSTSLFTMDSLEYFLKKINGWSLGQEYYRLDGSVPAEVRQKWCREFNAENNIDTKLFLISTRAGSLGLNMTAANRVIILDTSWNPAHDIQSIFRVYRFGQKKDCFIYRLVALGTMEQKIYERSVTKQAVACRVVDEQQIDRHYNSADLTELYKYDSSGAGVAGGMAVGVEDVVLLRVARRAGLHAAHEHDSLLRGSEPALPEHERTAAWLQFQRETAPPDMGNKKQTKQNNELEEQAYAKPATNKTKINVEKDGTYPISSKDKQKKNKKKTPVTEPEVEQNIQEDLSTVTAAPNSETIVKKIAEILLKHNYHNRQDPKEVAELVAKVKKIITDTGGESLPESDDVTVSIANVLLHKESITQPMDVPIKSEDSVINEPSTSTLKKRGRPKKNTYKIYEHEQHEPDVPTTFSDNAVDGRKRRRAALLAEKCFNDVNDDNISDRNDTKIQIENLVIDAGIAQESIVKSDPKKIGHRRSKSKTNKAVPSETATKIDSFDLDDDLSNDVEISTSLAQEPIAKSGPKEKVSKRTQFKMDIIKPQPTETVANIDFPNNLDNDPSNNPVISKPIVQEQEPMIKSIPKKKVCSRSKPKTNKLPPTETVTKIDLPINTEVGSSNAPVFSSSITLSDEDEPLRPKKPGPKRKTMISPKPQQEIVENNAKLDTHKPIYPLHTSLLSNENFIKIVAHTYVSGNPMLDDDAALLAARYSTTKALKESEATGKDITSGPLYDIAVKVLGEHILRRLSEKKPNSIPPRPQEEPIEVPPSPKEKSPKPQRAKSPIKLKIIVPSKTCKKSADKLLLEIDPGVVPVGLYKGTTQMTAVPDLSTEECILPDDDDVCLITSSPPPVRPHGLSPLPQATSTVTAKNIIISKFSHSVPKPVATSQPFPRAHTAPESILSDLDNTISLDSDEEDVVLVKTQTIVPSQSKVNEPVPVMITKAFPTNESILPDSTAPRPSPSSKLYPAVAGNSSVRKQTVNKSGPTTGSVNDLKNNSVNNLSTTPIQTTEIQPSVELHPKIVNLDKVVKKVVKPGDILHITSTGQMKVLKKIDKHDISGIANPLPVLTKVSNTREDSNTVTKNDNKNLDTALKLTAKPTTTKNLTINRNMVVIKEDVGKISTGAVSVKKQKISNAASTFQKIVESVDLTDFDIPMRVNKSKKSNDYSKKEKGKEIHMTSKPALPCEPKLLVPASQTSNTTESTSSTIMEKPLVVRTYNKVKRSASIEPVPAKKKKTDKPMTLQDFDIDDIDDIIELE